MKHTILLSALFFVNCLNAQIQFTNATQSLPVPGFYSYLTKGVCDLNRDGLDDIVVSGPTTINPDWALNVGTLYAFYQQTDGTFVKDSLGKASYSTQFSISIADIDNDGDNDVITGGVLDGLHVYNNSDNEYLVYSIPVPLIWMQGASMGDFNNDGFVDFFGCNDNGTSQIWMNDPFFGGLFPSNVIDFNTTPISDNSGNYGSIWTDFDDDGDLDLYIAKCSIYAVGDPTDPRRINTLYVNDGNGNFSELSEQYGLKSGAQSWTTEFMDIDNDGDLDCYITNHLENSQLLENIDNVFFEDITETAGVGDVGNPLQAIARDFDNDGYLDLLVSGDSSFLFKNNGDNTFTTVDGGIALDSLRSFAIGDLNNDGFEDIYASYYYLEGSDEKPDQLWLNTTNANNFLKVSLEGVETNRSAIGAKIKLYTNDGQIMVREVRSGESYGINNSLVMGFGLGDRTIDSLTVQWPSGIKDKLTDVVTNLQIDILEGSTAVTSVVEEQDFIREENPYLYSQSKNELKLKNSIDGSLINSVHVYDMSGRLIKQTTNNVTSISLPDSGTMMYVIQVSYSNFQTYSFKIVGY